MVASAALYIYYSPSSARRVQAAPLPDHDHQTFHYLSFSSQFFSEPAPRARRRSVTCHFHRRLANSPVTNLPSVFSQTSISTRTLPSRRLVLLCFRPAHDAAVNSVFAIPYTYSFNNPRSQRTRRPHSERELRSRRRVMLERDNARKKEKRSQAQWRGFCLNRVQRRASH